MESTSEKRELSAYWALRIVFGVVPILAGLDKFTNLLASWPQYLSPLARAVIPLSPPAFMHVAGVVEVIVGIAILSGYARVFGWVAGAWLLGIVLNLIATGHYLDIAARDLTMAVSAFALARLAPLHEHAAVTGTSPREARAHA